MFVQDLKFDNDKDHKPYSPLKARIDDVNESYQNLAYNITTNTVASPVNDKPSQNQKLNQSKYQQPIKSERSEQRYKNQYLRRNQGTVNREKTEEATY